jgi:hypothetical protein
MTTIDFKINNSARVAFTGARGHIQFHFIVDDKQVGKTFIYTEQEAAALGAAIVKIGGWDECPVDLESSDLRAFGQRLRDYAINDR